MVNTVTKLNRADIAAVFKTPQAVRAVEELQKSVFTNVDEIAMAQATADAANMAAGTANAAAVVANTAATNAASAASAASVVGLEGITIASNAEAMISQISALLDSVSTAADDLLLRPQAITGTLAMQNDDSVTVGAFGANGKDAQTAYSVGGAATDLPTVITLANNIRLALIANGIAI